MALPSCGIYKTSVTIGSVTAGHLVYFHNHGDPGPGIYLPESWKMNRAVFREQGFTVPDEATAATLEPLAAEGLYRVEREFYCCEKQCVTFPPELLVQLGYNRHAEHILFRPVWSESGLLFPETGQRVAPDRVESLSLIRVSRDQNDATDDTIH